MPISRQVESKSGFGAHQRPKFFSTFAAIQIPISRLMLHLNAPIPALDTLRAENLPVDVSHVSGALSVWLLNLMPEKAVTECDLCRMLAASGEEINLTLVKIPGQIYKTTPQEYMNRYYVDLDETRMATASIDGLIITGAPLEHMDFTAVRYWPQLCHLMAWSIEHVRSTLNICWAAQAALHFHHGVEKHPLSQKMFGIFSQSVLMPTHPLMAELDTTFPMPHSRHTEVRAAEFPSSLRILAESTESGPAIVVDDACRQVFAIGHLEYEASTLDREYRRDRNKGLDIQLPLHYYHNDRPDDGPDFSWRTAALTFYRNWVRSLR